MKTGATKHEILGEASLSFPLTFTLEGSLGGSTLEEVLQTLHILLLMSVLLKANSSLCQLFPCFIVAVILVIMLRKGGCQGTHVHCVHNCT